MPREIKPEKAATTIIDMIASGQATNAQDAVRQKPELDPGLQFLDKAVCQSATPASASGSSRPAPRRAPVPVASGSGPALLSR